MKTYLIAAAMLAAVIGASPALAFDENAGFADNFQFPVNQAYCASREVGRTRNECIDLLQENYDIDKMIWDRLDLRSRRAAIEWAKENPKQSDIHWVSDALANIARWQDQRTPREFQPRSTTR
jgi:hypothetical protein